VEQLSSMGGLGLHFILPFLIDKTPFKFAKRGRFTAFQERLVVRKDAFAGRTRPQRGETRPVRHPPPHKLPQAIPTHSGSRAQRFAGPPQEIR